MIRRLKAWLVKNRFSKDSDEYVALVDSNGSVDMDRLVDELMAQGTELKRETLINVISRYNRICADFTQNGYSVNTGLVHMRATIRGIFRNKIWNKDLHRLCVSVKPSKELRESIAQGSAEILGKQPNVTTIFSITDLQTGTTNSTIARGHNIEVKGRNIKLVGGDPDIGVFLTHRETGEEIKLPRAVVNLPSRLLLLIPTDIDEGIYEFQITTQYSKGSQDLLFPRTTIFSLPLTIL